MPFNCLYKKLDIECWSWKDQMLFPIIYLIFLKGVAFTNFFVAVNQILVINSPWVTPMKNKENHIVSTSLHVAALVNKQ